MKGNQSPSERSPRVSVLMPMRNAAAYVEAALLSILEEREAAFEIVVVDDGSTDGSRAIVESMCDVRIRVVDGPGQGIPTAFNTALEASRGDIIMRCDADDLFAAGRIARQLAWLDANADFGAVCGGFSAMNAGGRNSVALHLPRTPQEITDDLLNGRTLTHFCTFAVRINVFKRIGGARPFFTTGEDIDLQLRLGEECRVWYSPEQVYLYRLHDHSITHRARSDERDYFEAQARTFQLQRRRDGKDDLQRGTAVKEFVSCSNDVGSARSQLGGMLVGASWSALKDGSLRSALIFASRAIMNSPLSWAAWRNMGAIAVKMARSRMW